jgi:hypothetical protein
MLHNREMYIAKLKKPILLFIYAVIVSACGGKSYPSSASFSVPDMSVSVALERESIHPFLADYDRTLILLVNGREESRMKMFKDTGGYSRTNIFKVSESVYLLQDLNDV